MRNPLPRFAWALLAYNLGVILWGAYVRATGSGAGCGAHWPLCNGEVIPRAPTAAMLVEFSHRITSGLALVGVVALLWWTFKTRPPGDPARRGATWSMVFMLAEAAVGAGLVLFQLVADNASMARALFMAVHLVNTFLLVASLTLTAHWLSDGSPIRLAGRGTLGWVIGLGATALILVGVSGAIAALGDTLFPSSSIAEALAADLSPTSHALIRLRLLHPALSVTLGILLILGAPRLPVPPEDRRGHLASRALVVLAAVQLSVGFLNVLLLAPVWMQLVHLLIADLIWIAFVLTAASVLAARRTEVPVARAAAPVRA